MPLVPLKRVLFVSSEDGVHSASNLLSPASGLQWLSAGNYSGRKTEVEIELAKLTRLVRVEVGNCGSAFVEVLVRAGQDADYVSLLPQSILMSADESKSNRNHMRIKVFNKDKLNKAALDRKWSLVKVRCTQPYTTARQYGLKFIRFFSTDTSSPSSSSLPSLSPSSSLFLKTMSPSTAHNQRQKHTFSSPTSDRSHSECLTPSLPSFSTSKGEGTRLIGTPKRPRTDDAADENEEIRGEFSGIEKQSRLLKCTLKRGEAAVENNSILERIAAEKQKEVEDRRASLGGYTRKKLLHKDLPKTAADAGVDFAATYNDDSSKLPGLRAMRGLSSLDNSCEIGEDESPKSRWRTGRGGGRGGGGWKKTRYHKKPKHKGISIYFLPTKLGDMTDTVHGAECSNGDKFNSSADDKVNSISDSPASSKLSVVHDDDEVICSTSSSSAGVSCAGDGEVWEVCPVCGVKLPDYALELHASVCANDRYSPTDRVVVID